MYYEAALPWLRDSEIKSPEIFFKAKSAKPMRKIYCNYTGYHEACT